MPFHRSHITAIVSSQTDSKIFSIKVPGIGLVRVLDRAVYEKALKEAGKTLRLSKDSSERS